MIELSTETYILYNRTIIRGRNVVIQNVRGAKRPGPKRPGAKRPGPKKVPRQNVLVAKRTGPKSPGRNVLVQKSQWTKRPGPKYQGRNVLVQKGRGRNVLVRNV